RNPQSVPRPADAPFKHRANAEFTGHHTDVDGFALIGEARIARDHQETADLGEVGDHVLGYPVSKVFLLGIAAHVLKRQNGDRGPVGRRKQWGLFRRSGFRFGGDAHFERIRANRLGYVLELDFAYIADRQIEPRSDLTKGVLRQTDRAWLGDAFQSRGNI